MKLFVIALYVCLLSPVTLLAEPNEFAMFYQNADSMLMAHEFDKLDAMAKDFRKNESRFPGGALKITLLYSALGAIEGETCLCGGYQTTIPYEKKEAAVKKWLALQPKSLTARITMAKLLVTYAWLGRGHAYADKTTPEQWQLYRDRMGAAEIYIKELSPKDDAQVYSLWSGIARAHSSRQLLDTLYMAETKDYPRYFHFYGTRADILQSKWFGKPGELAVFTQSLLTNPGGEDGQIAYTFVADRLLGQYKDKEIFTKTGLDWNELKKAFIVREKRYGMDNSQWNVLLNLAYAANDRETAFNALQHVGNDWDKGVWTQRIYFEQVRLWATSKN